MVPYMTATNSPILLSWGDYTSTINQGQQVHTASDTPIQLMSVSQDIQQLKLVEQKHIDMVFQDRKCTQLP